MRRFLIVLLIALSPLRGWATAGMSVAMGVGQPGVATVATLATPAATPVDCPMMSATRGADAAQAQAGSPCQCCELCMPLAASVLPLSMIVSRLAQAAPQPGEHRFISADLPRAAKPPIL